MQNEKALQPQRQTYASPSLTTFGTVRDLTAAGSGTKAENGGAHSGLGYQKP